MKRILAILYLLCSCFLMQAGAYPTQQEYHFQFIQPLKDLVQKDTHMKNEIHGRWIKMQRIKKIEEFGGIEKHRKLKEAIDRGEADPASDPLFWRISAFDSWDIGNPTTYVYRIVTLTDLFRVQLVARIKQAEQTLNEQYKKLENLNENHLLKNINRDTIRPLLIDHEPLDDLLKCKAALLSIQFARKYNITKNTFEQRYFLPAKKKYSSPYYGNLTSSAGVSPKPYYNIYNIYERFINWWYPSKEVTDVPPLEIDNN